MRVSGKKHVVLHSDTGCAVFEGCYNECMEYAKARVNFMEYYSVMAPRDVVCMHPQPPKTVVTFTGERAVPCSKKHRR